jgi:hypothetical protein
MVLTDKVLDSLKNGNVFRRYLIECLRNLDDTPEWKGTILYEIAEKPWLFFGSEDEIKSFYSRFFDKIEEFRYDYVVELGVRLPLDVLECIKELSCYVIRKTAESLIYSLEPVEKSENVLT